MQSKNPDVAFTNLGSIVTIRPLSQEAGDWIVENVEAEAWQWLGDALCVEPRCAFDLYQAMQADGLICT